MHTQNIDNALQTSATQNENETLFYLKNLSTNTTSASENHISQHIKQFSFQDILNPKKLEYSLENIIPRGRIGTLYASGGTCKSLFTLSFIVHSILNLDFLSLNTSQETFLLISFEDNYEEVCRRLHGILRALNCLNEATVNTINNKLHFLDLTSNFAEDKQQIQDIMKDKNISFVIIDTLRMWDTTRDENDSSTSSQNLKEIIECCKNSNETQTILLLHHTKKNSSVARGSTVYHDNVRYANKIEKVNQYSFRLTNTKNNGGVVGTEVNFRLLTENGLKLVSEKEDEKSKEEVLKAIKEVLIQSHGKLDYLSLFAMLKEGIPSDRVLQRFREEINAYIPSEFLSQFHGQKVMMWNNKEQKLRGYFVTKEFLKKLNPKSTYSVNTTDLAQNIDI